jgi:carbon monoxide dehydrogenase subunit G
VARLLAKEKSMVPGCIVLFIFSLATVVQLVSIPSPVWMWLAGIAAFPVFGIIGMSLVPGCDQNVSTVRMIQAPLSVVFDVISRPDGFKAAVPGIQHIEFLSASHSGVGTRFVETRQMNGREAKAELEVTELNDNERVRIVSDMGGTVWDTLFCVRVVDEQVELTMSMDARPHNFLANLMTPMILPMVSKAVESDMDAVKKYCEKKYCENRS